MTAEVVKHLETAVNELQDGHLGLEPRYENRESAISKRASSPSPARISPRPSQSLRNSHSNFAGFDVSDAAIVGNWNGQLPAFKADLLKEVFDVAHKKAIADIEKNEHDRGQGRSRQAIRRQTVSALARHRGQRPGG